MRITKKTATCITSLILLITFPLICRGEALVSVSGIGAIEGGNQARAEQQALQDAFSKASLQVALKFVPQSSIGDLIRRLPEYTTSRGMQDIIQYQITSRSQQSGVLHLNVDVRMNDDSLKGWITDHAFTTPVGLRPKILFMMSYQEPGRNKAYEWWNDKNKTAYSAFESQFSSELKKAGENVIDTPQISRIPRSDFLKPIDIARAQGADILLTGFVTYLPIINRLHECSVKMSIIDVRSHATLSSLNVSHKSDLSASAMNSLMIDEIMKPVRTQISTKIISHAPVNTRKSLCIEGLSNYVTYQSIVNALRAMDGVSRLSITSLSGSSHGVCHAIDLKGDLTDVMENLKRQQLAEADMIVEDDKALIRIINQ